jgi:REP element-mobilizing transposase RayT
MERRRTTTAGQLALKLDLRRKPCGRGGWRPGAGRKKGGRVSHEARESLSGREPVHATLRLRPEASGLRRPKMFREVRRSIATSHRDDFRVCEYNVQSNHVHLAIEAESKDALSRGMQRLSCAIATRVNRCLDRRGPVFADRYHARVLRAPRQVRNCLVYILQNSRHHAPGNRRLSFDPWSSAASFTGWAGALPRDAAWMVDALAAPPATTPARTWLLTTGWRRLGLIGLDEAPRSGESPATTRR